MSSISNKTILQPRNKYSSLNLVVIEQFNITQIEYSINP